MFSIYHAPDAQVAQLVEQRTENPRVGGSNPPLGTTHAKASLVTPLFSLSIRRGDPGELAV